MTDKDTDNRELENLATVYAIDIDEEVQFGSINDVVGDVAVSDWLRPFLLLGMSKVSLITSDEKLCMGMTRKGMGGIPDFTCTLVVGPKDEVYGKGYIFSIASLVLEKLIAFSEDYPLVFEIPEVGKGAWWADMAEGEPN